MGQITFLSPPEESGNTALRNPQWSPGLSLGGVCNTADIGSVYGRFSDLQAAYSLQLPSSPLNQCQFGVFVPDYRCGAVPGSHRIPFSLLLSRHRKHFEYRSDKYS